MRSRGVCAAVILTLGRRGAFSRRHKPANDSCPVKVKPLDSTAAGDIFNGALSVALAEGKTVPDAVRFANAAAALSVTRLGAQPSAPSRADIEKFLRSRR